MNELARQKLNYVVSHVKFSADRKKKKGKNGVERRERMSGRDD